MRTPIYLSSLVLPALLSSSAGAATLVEFEKQSLTSYFYSEGACFADIDGDGKQDVVSGPFWYAGPDFTQKHSYMKVERFRVKEYSSAFFTFAHDFNGDGRPDILRIPMPGTPAYWHENPGRTGVEWKQHLALGDVGNESPQLADVTGDGKPELVCCSGGKIGYAEVDWGKPGEPWKFTALSERDGYGRFTHGLGIGDVNGDGRADILETAGWWEQPAEKGKAFELHAVPFAQSGGAQMFTYDFDDDGDQDVIAVQNAHGWGLSWFEQKREGEAIRFTGHPIMTANPADNPYALAFSQMHALALEDIDGDGVKDVITGKRYFAHGGADPGAHELPVLYWFKTIREAAGVRFEPWLVDKRCGVGTQLTVGDLDGDQQPDIVVGNKLGSFVLRGKRREVSDEDYAKLRPRKSATPPHVAGTDQFASHVRASEPLPAEEELKSFVLPDGFEIQLVTAEPEIAKPMNLAFDKRGRIWVSSTVEYPYAAPLTRKGRDTIKILEDLDGDGRADKITTFADGLNIPIGLYPYGDGVIAFSIPNIWYLRDTDGDDVCDVREKLYGPVGYDRDTHGMCNGFTRGVDGWLYACHGFNNRTTLSGTDGHEISMNSGTIFRMRVDGSRAEVFTRGLVNPFGMAFDALGDALAADCHTKPVSLLVREGHHSGFGAVHDGLGYIPNVMEHLHGSTAIAGIVLGSATAFPEEYRESVFGGNVTTCRINRNTLFHQGSSPQMQEESDFLISDDPWFRPVDLQVGPDGALYVADFYNRVIGHYEVPLDHKGRDRTSGRIWRIVHRDAKQRMPDLARASLGQLVAELASPIGARISLVQEEIVERFGAQAVPEVRSTLTSADEAVRSRGLWVLHRLDAIGDAELAAGTEDASARVRNHAFRVLAARPAAPAQSAALLVKGFSDSDPMVRRAAATAAAVHTSESLLQPLLTLVRTCPKEDGQLNYAGLMAVRNHLRNDDWFSRVAQGELSDADARQLAGLCLSLKTRGAAEFVILNLNRLENDKQLGDWLKFAVQYADAGLLDRVAEVGQRRFQGDPAFQLTLLNSIDEGLGQRGQGVPESIRGWAAAVARQLLAVGVEGGAISWSQLPAPGQKDEGDSWVLSTRRTSSDGQANTPLYSSFLRGEQRTGLFRSGPFQPGSRFSFYLAGHDGPPPQPIQGRNFVRMRDARTHAVLHQTAPPRNDVAQRIEWNTEAQAGGEVYLELVDGDTGNAYAWMAAGRFSVAALNPSRLPEDRRMASELISRYKLAALRPELAALLKESARSGEAVAFARALVATGSDSRQAILPETLAIHGVNDATRARAIALLAGGSGESPYAVVGEVMKSATAAEQTGLATRLVTLPEGNEALLQMVESGTAAARLLNEGRVAQSFDATANDGQKARRAALTRDLFDDGGEMDKLISARRESYLQKAGVPARGQELFRQHCMLCHQVAGEGKNLAPNLDGIGNRGLERIVEDILDPNRNVDTAFRIMTLVLKDGNSVSGFLHREEGAQLIMAEIDGTENRVPAAEVKERVPSTLSLMPPTFGFTLNEEQFRDLLAWLLSLR